MMLEFFNFLNSIHPLSAEATAALMKVIKMKELRRGQVWLQEGTVCDKLTFVVKGLMKLYFESATKELVLHISREDEFIFSVQSYYDQSPSLFSLRAAEPSVIIYIQRNEMAELIYKFSELNSHLIVVTQQISQSLEQHIALLLLPPKERWALLPKMNKWIANESRITDRLIAAYLGVSTNSVCNWRNNQH